MNAYYLDMHPTNVETKVLVVASIKNVISLIINNLFFSKLRYWFQFIGEKGCNKYLFAINLFFQMHI
jgi:hypothetical protein